MTLYHQEACEAVDEDSLLELCDWGYRKLLSLNAKHHTQARGESGHACRVMTLVSLATPNITLHEGNFHDRTVELYEGKVSRLNTLFE